MEKILIITSLAILSTTSAIMAQPPSSYGPPSSNFNRNQDTMGFQSFRSSLSGGNTPILRNNAGTDPSLLGANIQGPKVFRHISLFVAPQEPGEQRQRVRTIQPQQAPDKHYQIIFIKAPSQSNAQQTEVILPEQPEQKTLVYVLLKKGEAAGNNVRIRGPSATKPPAPEVYFIKYKDGASNVAAGAVGAQLQQGYPSTIGSAPVRASTSSAFSTSYGVPS